MAGKTKREPLRSWYEVKIAFQQELSAWRDKQVKDMLKQYYIWYLPSTASRSGDIRIAVNKPGKGWELAAGEHVRRDMNVRENLAHFEPIIRRLPILALSNPKKKTRKKNIKGNPFRAKTTDVLLLLAGVGLIVYIIKRKQSGV